MPMNFATSLTGGVSVHLKMAVPSLTSSNMATYSIFAPALTAVAICDQ